MIINKFKKDVFSAFIFSSFFLFTTSVHAKTANLSLMYDFGGCQSELYTPESYWVKPVLKDIYKNNKTQIIFGNYSVIVLDATTGKETWRVNGGYDRTKPYQVTGGDVGRVNKIEVVDIDSNGYDEIVVAHGNGWISVLSHDGYMKPGWPQQVKHSNGNLMLKDVRSLHVEDLDNNGKCEIIVGAATTTSESVWVYTHDGKVMPGWPQLSGSQDAIAQGLGIKNNEGAYSNGMFMNGVTAGDINGDGIKEILAAIDDAYLNAYDIKGKIMPANSTVFGGRAWGKVALWEDYSYENSLAPERKKDHNWNQGHGYSYGDGRSQLYRGELGQSSVRVIDIDNDGKNEVLLTAIMVDKKNDERNKTWGENDLITSKYMSVFVFNGDRTRYKGWEMSPSNLGTMGGPIFSYQKSLSLEVESVPVVGSLNGDGVNQIVTNTYDGKIHAFSYNNPKKEFGKFPYSIPRTDGVIELPNEVVLADVTGDGKKNIIFTTNTKPASGEGEPTKKGGVYVLNPDGTLLCYHELPDGYKIWETKKAAYTNGSMAAPAVKDVDGDGKFEIVVNTKYSGVATFKVNTK